MNQVIIASNWWSLVIRGIVAVLFGIVTFAWPGITLAAWVLMFGAFALVDGVLSIVGAVKAAKAHERWGSLLISGIMGILAAAVTIVWPLITALALVYVVAAWAIVTGSLETAAAVRLRKHIRGEWLLALSGVASLLLGILLIINPVAGALVLTIWFGAWALVFGALLIALGIRLRSWGKTLPDRPSVAVPVH